MRLAFFGTPQTAVPALDALLDAGHEIRLVVTRPDRAVGRGKRLTPTPIRVRAEERGLPALLPRAVRGEELLGPLRDARPEALVVVAYGRILPAAVLGVAPRGAINLHFSLLPALRGAAPVQWCVACGETRTGVTTMRMNERMDEGPILLQEATDVAPGEHAPALAARLAAIGARLLVETLRRLAVGEIAPIEQDARAASYAPRLVRADGWVDPTLAAREIEGRIRGFDPWPGAWVRCRGRRLRLVDGRALECPESGAAPGTVLALGDAGLEIACGHGTVLGVVSVQPEGRQTIGARDAVNGRHVRVGDVVERIEADGPAGLLR